MNNMRNINEVRYIDTRYQKGPNGIITKKDWNDVENQLPIKDNETIRVFHGCDLKTAVTFAKQGLSGKQRQPRKYSYENGMNPIGLFVSTDFETVKEFSNPFGGGKAKNASVIIEFTANSNDLDTPVWNDSETYFGQGSNPMPFNSRDDRNKQKQTYNTKARNSECDYIKNSDNPAMANNIFNNKEHQALFIGDLSPNMIKRFWIKRYNGNSAYDKQYIPIKREQFLKEFGDEEFSVDGYYGKTEKITNGEKLFKPNEDFTSFEDMAKRDGYRLLNTKYGKGMLKRKYNGDVNKFYEDYIKENANSFKELINNGWYDELQFLLWPKQLIQLLGKEKYMEIYDKFGIGVKNEDKDRLVEKCVRIILQKIFN